MAADRGLVVTGSEIVGLVPDSALTASADHYLRLERFTSSQVIETRLREVGREAAHRADVTGFLDRLAARTPTPGGGSVPTKGLDDRLSTEDWLKAREAQVRRGR